ncbi:MAG: M48 family metalloprotease [Bacteroidia bacterium]|nr:M48 family metalloprotease [Bacteroidia bacterium]
MKYRLILGLLLVGIFLQRLSAQNWDHYTPIQASGEIPAEFLSLSSFKFAREKENLNPADHHSNGKPQEDFLLQSQFLIDELLISGKVLFNDPLSLYLGKVADKLLASRPELRQELRIYAVKSSSANAFATNNGIIFVNTGLLAQLENEAQLAYILAHEIQHYLGKHPLNQYVETIRIDQGAGMFKRQSLDERLLAKTNYSRELELEADLKGLDLYLESAYDPAGLDQVFDVLRWSYLPFDEVPFSREFLQTEHITYPESYFLQSVSGINPEGEGEEEGNNHPSLNKRQAAIANRLASLPKSSKSHNLVGENEFKNAREMARFELSHLFYQQREYQKAIYNSYLLGRDHGHNLYLQKNICQSLYALARYANARHLGDVLQASSACEGEIQQLASLLEHFTDYEMTTVALAHTWDRHLEFPQDPDLDSLVNALLLEMVEHHGDFLDRLYRESPADSLPADPSNGDPNGKYDKLRRNRENEKYGEKGYIYSAFVGMFAHPDFRLRLENAKASFNQTDSTAHLTFRERKKALRKARKEGKSLGTDQIVMVQPLFQKIDRRKEIPVRYIAGETGQRTFTTMLSENAEMVGLGLNLLEVSRLQTSQVAEFNDIARLNDWISDRFAHDEVGGLLPPDQAEIDRLVQKYGTRYFAWTGTLSLTEKPNTYLGCFYLALVYTAPLGVYHLLSPSRNTLYFTLVYDLKTGGIALANLASIGAGARYDLMQSNIYDTLLRIKQKPG